MNEVRRIDMYTRSSLQALQRRKLDVRRTAADEAPLLHEHLADLIRLVRDRLRRTTDQQEQRQLLQVLAHLHASLEALDRSAAAAVR